MKVVFAPRALLRLREIQPYIAYDNGTAAASVVSRIRQSTEMIAFHPLLGREWDDGRTRACRVRPALPHPYRIDEGAGTVEIITVMHTSQKPPRFE